MTQYDVEQFQKIEQLTGQQMEQYAAEQEAVLLLLERVGDAQRMAVMQVRCCMAAGRARGLLWQVLNPAGMLIALQCLKQGQFVAADA